MKIVIIIIIIIVIIPLLFFFTKKKDDKNIFHRKTFIKGKLISKFYGQLDYIKDAQDFVKERYFDFTLYDAEIKNSSFRKNNDGEFPEFNAEELFPGSIQPSPLPCKISYNNIIGDFEIVLYDVMDISHQSIPLISHQSIPPFRCKVYHYFA